VGVVDGIEQRARPATQRGVINRAYRTATPRDQGRVPEDASRCMAHACSGKSR